MSRFVRASKYRHVFGQSAKKEYGYENVKVTNSAWDTNIVSASAEYISVNWNSSGGGAFAILPLPSPFAPIASPAHFPHKLPDSLPLARGHTATVLDTAWSPHNDALVASAAEDGKTLIWKIEPSAFEGWGADGWEPQDFDPVLRIDTSPRKVGQVVWHPTAANVLATASGDALVKLWDLANPEDARVTLTGHGDIIQSLAFNATGTLLATTCRDRKIRLFDPRAGGEAVRVNDGHSGIKGSRVVWMGEMDRIATTGFSKMSERQACIWETGSLENLKTISLDQSAGVVMPFWSDNNILFLAGKGDGNIRYYEYESDSLFSLSEYKSSDPQRGMCFLPRRALAVSDCEIARAYKVYGSTIEPIGFIVPRKADSFQADIFPPAPSRESGLSAAEFFGGKKVGVRYVSLEDGREAVGVATPTRTVTAPAPAPAAAPAPERVERVGSRSASLNVNLDDASPATPTPTTPSYQPSHSTPSHTTTTTTTSPQQSHSIHSIHSSSSSSPPQQQQQAQQAPNDTLKEENARLAAELRVAREKIRGLELQVESMRVNARRAVELLDS